MTFTPWLGYLGGSALIAAVSRMWVLFRRDRRARRAFAARLFPPGLLESALAPRAADDKDVLAEILEVLGHLNRQTYAEELWRVDEQLAAYYARLPKASRPTMRDALLRLLRTQDRWLRLLSAKTCARIGMTEAAGELEKIVHELTGSLSGSDADRRYAEELQSALERIRET
jgi:hypothetical protein